MSPILPDLAFDSDYEKAIRATATSPASGPSDRVLKDALAALLAEIDRLRLRVDEVERKYTSDTADLKREIADLKRERDALKKWLFDAAMTKTWTNEDGKRFVFVEDIAPALLGTGQYVEGGGRDE